MVKNRARRSERGSLMIEVVVALGILTSVLIPLSYSFVQEGRLCRDDYRRAIAMEIVDGEMEILAAGEWQAFHEGAQSYPIHAESARNLPAGDFVLTIHGHQLRLEWHPVKPVGGGAILREAAAR